MKNLKSILCSVFVFIFGAILLTGCSFDNSGNPKKDSGENEINSQYDSVAVAEAKNAITNALIFEDDIRFGYDNRNMYEKLGKITARMVGGSIIFDIKGEYRDGRFVKCLWGGDGREQYLEGSNYYTYNLSNQLVNHSSVDELPSYYAVSLAMGGGIDETKLFTDQSFLKYKSAEKTNFANYYTWSLYMPCNQLLELQGFDTDSDYAKKVKDEYSNEYQLKVVLLFNKNNNQIEKVKLEIPAVNIDNELIFCTFEVAKFSGKITTPQWCTDYIASQND